MNRDAKLDAFEVAASEVENHWLIVMLPPRIEMRKPTRAIIGQITQVRNAGRESHGVVDLRRRSLPEMIRSLRAKYSEGIFLNDCVAGCGNDRRPAYPGARSNRRRQVGD